MIRIRFPDVTAEQHALGFLSGRFSFKSWANGEPLVPSAPLSSLAIEGIPFSVLGPATYEQYAPTLPSVFDLFGKARMLRTGEEIARQLQEERDAWGEP